MKLSRLLQEHRNFSPAGSVAKNLGDGYLVQKNRIYGRLRAAVLAEGFKLSDERNDAYNALPLSQLENVLSSKTLPYSDNVSVLELLETKRPGLVDWEDVQANFRRNLLFHETCHAVARARSTEIWGPATIPTDKTERTFAVARALLEESFANSCELLAAVDADDAAHRVFYEANSYTSLFEERTNLKNALNDLGDGTVWKHLLLSYFAANLLHPLLEDRLFERVARFSGVEPKALDPKKLKTLRALSKIAFRLDLGFRTTTTGFYFRMSGVTGEMHELLDFDFMAIAERNDARRWIDALIGVASGAKASSDPR